MIQPIGLRVVVRKDEVKQTAGGVVLPTGSTKSNTGTIVAVGRGAVVDGVFQEVEFEVGDKVIFQAYSGTEISVNNEKLLVLDCRDILAQVPENVRVG